MDVHQLRCFVAVAEEQHFGRAADRLHLTPSPVSRAVKDLERELGADLFVRRYHRVELTEAGRRLLERAQRVLADFDDLRSAIGTVGNGSPVIHVGGTHLAPPTLMDRVVALAERVADGRPVDVRLGPSSDLLPDVEAGAIEMALVHLPLDSPALDSLAVGRYRFLVAMRSDDELAGAAELVLAELAHRIFLLTSPRVQPVAMKHMHDELTAAGVHRFEQLPDNDMARLAGRLRRGGALTLTTSPTGGGSPRVFDDPAFAVVPLRDGDLEFLVGLTWRRDRVASDPDVRALVDMAHETWRDGPDTV